MKVQSVIWLLLLGGLCGGICGLVSVRVFGEVLNRERDLQSLSLRDLTIRDAHGNISIRLYNGDHGPVLALIDPSTQKDAIQIAVSGASRRINFLTKDGDSVTALVSTNPSRASTLYLGDDRVRTRIILGAHQHGMDMPDGTKDSVPEWGLSLRNPRRITEDIARLLVLDYINEPAPRVIGRLPQNAEE